MSFFTWLYRKLFCPLLPRFILEARTRSSEWRRVRQAHLEKEPVCQACGRNRELDVHHIVPVSFDPTKELDLGNLITLCSSPCHIVFGHLLNYQCYNKDVRNTVRVYRATYENQRACLSRTPQ